VLTSSDSSEAAPKFPQHSDAVSCCFKDKDVQKHLPEAWTGQGHSWKDICKMMCGDWCHSIDSTPMSKNTMCSPKEGQGQLYWGRESLQPSFSTWSLVHIYLFSGHNYTEVWWPWACHTAGRSPALLGDSRDLNEVFSPGRSFISWFHHSRWPMLHCVEN
jgi:hypothetical protein